MIVDGLSVNEESNRELIGAIEEFVSILMAVRD